MGKNGCTSEVSMQIISKLIELVLTKIIFNLMMKIISRQKFGTAMGTRMAPFMGKFEKDFDYHCRS